MVGADLDEWEQFATKAQGAWGEKFARENINHMQETWASLSKDERGEALTFLNDLNSKAGGNPNLPCLTITDARTGHTAYDITGASIPIFKKTHHYESDY